MSLDLGGMKVLITGGSGTFGQAFARMTAEKFNPRSIVILSRDDMKHEKMRKDFPNFDYFLGDVRDLPRLKRAFHACDVVIHAAALKIVPTAEYDPWEYIKTNIEGSRNVVDAAIDCEVPQVIGISTDKAVRPCNLYGQTKAVMEAMFKAGNSYNLGGVPCISTVRYGNVMGSNGSVIPLFIKQKDRGILTVTDPEMTRFMMTIEQAVELVWDALEANAPGLYLPKELPSMKVLDLARTIAPNAEIKVIGIRPGEKIHEAMWENSDGTVYSSDKPARWFHPEELRTFLSANYPGWEK